MAQEAFQAGSGTVVEIDILLGQPTGPAGGDSSNRRKDEWATSGGNMFKDSQ